LPVLKVPERTIVTRTSSGRRTIGKIATFAGIGLALTGAGIAWYAKHDYGALFVDPDGLGPGLAHCGAYPRVNGQATCLPAAVAADPDGGRAALAPLGPPAVAPATGAYMSLMHIYRQAL
ncbi:MAG: hypothetical protein ABJC36_07235, partial [Gemmatimonadales bacterium]